MSIQSSSGRFRPKIVGGGRLICTLLTAGSWFRVAGGGVEFGCAFFYSGETRLVFFPVFAGLILLATSLRVFAAVWRTVGRRPFVAR